MNALLADLISGAPPRRLGDSPLAERPLPPVQKLHYTHEAMIDLIIKHPDISGDQLAEYFGYSPSWISNIIVSDMFQNKLAARRAELVDPELRESLKIQLSGLLHRSMEVLRRKLDRAPEEIPDQLAVQVAKMASTGLGLGEPKRASSTEVHVHLSELGNNLVGLLRRGKAQAVVDAEVCDVQESERPPGS